MEPPFPVRPMTAIGMCLLFHSYALCSLFPYVGYMVRFLGATQDKDEAGYYAGYLSSAFMIGRCAGSYFWGRIGDRYGRLPVMYLGLASSGLLLIAFGLSTSYLWAVVIRVLTGALNGILANAKTMISEVCGKEHEVVGMSLITGCWAVGLVLGSGIGGMLAEPVDHYPTVFSESGLFGRFPYLLPNILGTSLAMLCFPLVFFFLEETLDVRKGGDRLGFESLTTPKAGSNSQLAVVGRGGVVQTTCLDIGCDPQLASDGASGRKGASGGGDKLERETAGSGSGGDGKRSFWAGAEKHLPLVRQNFRRSSGEPELEAGGVHSVHSDTREDARPKEGAGEGGEGGAVDAGGAGGAGGGGGGGVSPGEGRKLAFLEEALLPLKLLKEKRIRTDMFAYVLFSAISFGCHEVYPLWALSTLASGGLNWTTKQVGQALSICGGGMVIFEFCVYPFIVKRIGQTRSQRWACCIMTPVVLSYPLLSGLHDDGRALLAVSLVLLFFTNVGTTVVFTNVSLATNNAVPPSQRSTINGLQVMLGSLAKATGPVVSSTVFAWSISRPRLFPLDNHLIFILFALGMVVVTVTSWNIDISPIKRALPEGGGGGGGGFAAAPVSKKAEFVPHKETGERDLV